MLTLLDFPTLLQMMAGAAQGTCAILLDLAVGSPLRSILEANAAVALWLQWLILQVLSRTRLSSSVGADADSWVADYGLSRLPPVAAGGTVTFSRGGQAVNVAATIPVGSLVKSADYTQTFQVVEDDGNVFWDVPSGGYIIPAGIAAATLPVENIVPGTVGNVQAGTVVVISSSLVYVDFVTNAAPIANAVDAESDAALRARFKLYINTRSLGTVDAIVYAITSIAQNLTAQVFENVPYIGTVTVIVDDGTGSPSPAIVASAQAVANSVRAITVQVLVQGPTVVPVSVSMALKLTPGLAPSQSVSVLNAAKAAVLSYINGLPVSGVVGYLTLPAVAIGSGAGIVGVVSASYRLNNTVGFDVDPGSSGIAKATSASVVISGA